MKSAASLITALHDGPTQLVLAVTGGGSRVIADLLEVPGGSATLLEALVPYANTALTDFLGGVPDQYCSAETARAMAMRAFGRALTLRDRRPRAGEASKGGFAAKVSTADVSNADVSNADVSHAGVSAAELLGVGCTASLVSRTVKRGAHRAHVGLQSSEWTESTCLMLPKGARDRRQEEALVGDLLLWRILTAAGIPCDMPSGLLDVPSPTILRTRAPEDWRALLLGSIPLTRWPPLPAKSPASNAPNRLVFPGAFNPLHDGHRKMAAWAASKFGAPVEFEISIENVDKPPLDYTDLERRVAQFSADQPVWLTRAPTFAAKADLFPGATFLVGADTVTRIGDPRYYGARRRANEEPGFGGQGLGGHDFGGQAGFRGPAGEGSQAACRQALQHLADRNCSFLVFGRLGESGFACLDDLDLPTELRALCRGTARHEFRVDLASSDIRSTAKRLGDSGLEQDDAD